VSEKLAARKRRQQLEDEASRVADRRYSAVKAKKKKKTK